MHVVEAAAACVRTVQVKEVAKHINEDKRKAEELETLNAMVLRLASTPTPTPNPNPTPTPTPTLTLTRSSLPRTARRSRSTARFTVRRQTSPR